jgi:hypothetical protein
MKLTKSTYPRLVGLVAAFIVLTTVAWDVVEALVRLLGGSLDLSVGPIGFDAGVFAVWMRPNPGTVLGVLPGVLVFRAI